MARALLLGRVRNTGRMEVKSPRTALMEGFRRLDSHPPQNHAFLTDRHVADKIVAVSDIR